jgi:hypothetical protein
MRRAAFALAAGLAAIGLVSPANAAEEAPQPRPPASARRVGAKMEGGATVRRIFGLPIVGGEGSLAIGSLPATRKTGAPEVFVHATYGFGRTENGLAVHVARVGAQIDFPIGRLRPWISADGMWLGIARITEHGLVAHWGLGAAAGLDIDVVRTSERGGLYVGPRVGLDLFPHKLVPRTASPTASLTAGLRF